MPGRVTFPSSSSQGTRQGLEGLHRAFRETDDGTSHVTNAVESEKIVGRFLAIEGLSSSDTADSRLVMAKGPLIGIPGNCCFGSMFRELRCIGPWEYQLFSLCLRI